MNIKIDGFDRGVNGLKNLKLNAKRDAAAELSNFKDELNSASMLECQERLIDLSKSIIEQGKIIAEKCDIKEFAKYKKLISSFLEEMVSSGFAFCKEGKVDYQQRKRFYANVIKINENVDKLAEQLLSNQKEQLNILKTLEDIRGLILDTFI